MPSHVDDHCKPFLKRQYNHIYAPQKEGNLLDCLPSPVKEGNLLDCSPSPVLRRDVGDSYRAEILALKRVEFFCARVQDHY